MSFASRLFLLLGFIISSRAFHFVPSTSAIASNMFGSLQSRAIRVVSYNVLSPNLATPASYPTLAVENLDPSKRLEAVLQKIEKEISQQRVIVCLQEVSYEWAGSLHTFFANRGYHLVTGLYGRPFNGYMGVVMAWPTASFEVLDVDIARLSDKREGGWPREDPDSEEPKDTKPCFSLFSWLFPKKKSDEKPPLDPWQYSERRFNVLLTATLKEKESQNKFCIGNYHMPCAFYAPQVMTIHSEMAAYRVQQLAQEHSEKEDDMLPYIVAGDWNIKPPDAAYKLLTTGTLEEEDPAYPLPAKSKRNTEQTLMTWEPRIEAMTSAYAAVNDGKEPDFTNYAAPRSLEEDDECFIDTLDYIFVSPQWKVLETTPIPHRDEVKGPFPNLEEGMKEPSDHVLISAKLELEGKR